MKKGKDVVFCAIIAFRGKSEFGKSKYFTVFISSRVVIDLLRGLRGVIVGQSNRVPV